MKNTYLPLSILLVIVFPLTSFQQSDSTQKVSIFTLLRSEAPLKLEIRSPLDDLVENKNTNDYFPSTLKFKDNQGKRHKWEAEVRSRGRFRRMVCQFPPLKIKFSKEALKEQGLKKHNEFKLVTHCIDTPEGDEYLIREYLAYQLYDIITGGGFRTQLVKATYLDTQSPKRIDHYAILIEDEDDLEDRMKGKICEDCFNPPVENLNLEAIHQMALFQFMIGNTDWSIPLSRNLKLVIPKDSSGYVATPYDFDFSGLVNPPYAIPNSDYNLENCRQRFFIGYAEDEKDLQATIDLFKEKKQAVIQYIEAFKYLSKPSRKDIINYIETFYACLEQGNFLNRIVDPKEFD